MWSCYDTDDMETLSVAEAKRRFSELIDRVQEGERFLVSRRGKPAVALVPTDDVDDGQPRPRGGLLALVGALADVEDLDEMVRDIYGARGRARDRPPPELD